MARSLSLAILTGEGESSPPFCISDSQLLRSCHRVDASHLYYSMTARTFPLFLCASVVACGHGSSRSADSGSVHDLTAQITTASRAAPASTQTSAAPCPGTGRWALCSLEKRLRQSGFVVRRVGGEAPRRAGFSVAPVAYALGRSRLEVFVYRDEASLAKDIAGIDSVTASPRGTSSTWEATPTLVRSANLAAVFLADSPVQAERLTLAITAGPPQPNSGR